MTDHVTTLNDVDAFELGEMLEFLHDLFACEPVAIQASLDSVTGGGCDIAEIRADLARFAVLLPGNGHRLFGVAQ
jgi:hypothetical protein